MSDTPRLLTMTAYEWQAVERTIDEHSALEPSYVDALHSEVLAQAARVQALEDQTERALGAFRAWLAEANRYVLAEFDRRFGRTP